ncbi:uncharacterized protein LOC134825883 isoform X2 [Bolinopsis microptera]|uniref:uncharacterized protein LOC134825883 isoform X2 n=1 Tax=Bolinopsis microptera TaxID=2820187 RepID=UPI0030797139
MIEDLLICSADPTIKEGRGQTPLHYATMHNKTEGVVEMLVKYGAPVNLQDIHHNSPLHLAAMFGNLVAVRELVRYKVDMTAMNSRGFTPMDVACLYGHSKVAALFLQTHSSVLLTMGTVAARHDKTQTTPLHLAARKGHTDTCLMLLKHGFNVNRESTSGTALHEAVLHGRLEVTQLLCDHGADVTIKNVHGQTPLHVAQKLSAAHSADKLAAIILKYSNQEAMVGQAMEECIPEQLTDLDVKHGELVHIIAKNSDGRWRCFVVRKQVQKVGHVPWFKLELLSSLCKPATYMRASSQVLSERNISHYGSLVGSLYSLASDYPAIPGNERLHSVAVNGVSVTEQTARLLATPDVVVSYEDAQAQLYEWLNMIGLGHHLSSFLDTGYDSPVLLAGITEAELKHVGITDAEQRRLLMKSASCLHEDNYLLVANPESVEDWLGALGLSTYSAQFSHAGYDYLGDMTRMTPTLLIKVGVTKPGHRTKILAAGVGLQKWILEHPLPPRPEKLRPRKPARSISKNSNYSFDTGTPPLSAGLRLQDEPICSSYWESYTTDDNSLREESVEDPLQTSNSFNCDNGDRNLADKSFAPSVSTNPFDTDDEDLALELTSTIKPKRKSKPTDDGISTIQRERIFTLERRATATSPDTLLRKAPAISPVSDETPPVSPEPPLSPERPLSPGETRWNSEDILGSSAHNVSYAGSGASNTSSDIMVHAEKRGSSEHLDPISPPPKTECEEEDSLQDCVDLIRDPSPATSDHSKRNSLHISSPPSPKGYYETDIIPISNPDEKDKENINVIINPAKVLKRSVTESAVIGRKESPEDDICDSCKLKEKPLTVEERKQLFLNKLDQRMSTSDAMKNINWESMSPAVAAVVKSVYCDDTDDIGASQQAGKKVPPPVAPKPKKYSFKRATSEGHITVTRNPESPSPPIITNYDSKPIDPIIEKPAIIEAPIAEEKPLEESSEIKLETSDKIEKLDSPPRATGASVFDDLENMFDEFSKELDSFLT